MTTLAEYMIVVGDENRPPMLDKSMYNSWESRMLLYIKGKKNDRMMLEYIENGPLVYLTVEENGLGISSITAKNLSLLGHWKWRFLSEDDALWRTVIQDFYGSEGGFVSDLTPDGIKGVWHDINKAVNNIDSMVDSSNNSFSIKVLTGINTSFWKDSWFS
ncbi:hypothetical protein Tco_0822359 [Tanacetum coccineum]|uniref:Uncharacterized protein n=1 Tax=Tanacetum coccineum TaxID=301880 RepID=A0ABQ5AEW2_9ASTR